MSNVLRVLVIDDEDRLREALKSELEELHERNGDGSEWDIQTQDFSGVESALLRFRPDMIVLDLIEGQISDENDSGNSSFEHIRRTWFCPVVVYTGFADRREFGDHPQVTQVTKGKDSEVQVFAKLQEFAPLATMIRSVHRDFDRRIREALRDSVDALERQVPGSGSSDAPDVSLSRAVRRQVAARVDLAASADAVLHAWERFLVPPLGGDLLTADLLRSRDASWDNPRAFRIVLSPSCDLIRSGDRTPKVERALVARCEPLRVLGKITLPDASALTSRQRKYIRPLLAEGIVGQHLVVPEFQGHVPLMAADLRSLDLVGWDRIELSRGGLGATGRPEFLRVASTDSPFREMVVWAYLRVTGRPGLPEINVDQWLSDISDHVEHRGQV